MPGPHWLIFELGRHRYILEGRITEGLANRAVHPMKLGSFRPVQVVGDCASVPDAGVDQNRPVRMTDREPVDRYR